MAAVVVGAALLDGAGRVLAARRADGGRYGPAGGWEFPGGKVEAGESEVAALVRECREELGVAIRVDRRVGPEVPTGDGRWELRVWTARVLAGEPTAREHAELRWLASDQLDTVGWLPADLPIVAALRAHLAADPARGESAPDQVDG